MTFAYGKESRNWKRKPLKVWIDCRQSFGKWVDVLILTPIDWPSFAPKENIPTINVGTQAQKPAVAQEQMPEEFNDIPE